MQLEFSCGAPNVCDGAPTLVPCLGPELDLRQLGSDGAA